MKKLIIAAFVASAGIFASCSNSSSISGTPSVSSSKDSLSYAVGYQLGMMLKSASIPNEDLDMTIIAKTINATMNDGESVLSETEIQEVMTNYFTQVLPGKMQERNSVILDGILKENPNAKKSESGIVYEIIEAGDEIKATPVDTVSVHYTGSLFDGSVFDSSYQEDGTSNPLQFAPLMNSIQGFQEAVGLVGQGGHIKVWIPSELAYGERGAGQAIAPNTNIMFEIEVETVTKAK